MNQDVLVLRTCRSYMTSYRGFRWPESGPVEAPDWDPTPSPGHGLHGWLWGEGNGAIGYWSDDARWLVVRVPADTIVDLGGKVKFPRGEVVHCGDRESATRYLVEHGGAGRAIIGRTATSGYGGAAISGDRGASTSGNWSASMSGDHGSATSENYGISITRNCGTSITGDRGMSISWHRGRSMSGHRGTSITEDGGMSITGDGGMSITGDGGIASAGIGGVLIFRWYVYATGRIKTIVAHVGEDGIEPNKPYRCVDGKVVPAETEVAHAS